MGIGYALASGLVQGFTQNIGREMERRAAEKEKLEAYRMAITNAALTGGEDFNKANAKVIGEMVSAAEGRLDKQAGIDLFGTAGDSIFEGDKDAFEDLIAKLQGGDPTTKDMIKKKIGTFEFLVPEEYNDQVGTDRANVILYDAFADAVAADPDKFKNHVRETGERDVIVDELGRLTKASIIYKSRGAEGAPGAVKIGLSNLKNYDFFDDFLNISKGQKFQAESEAFKETQAAADIFGTETILSPDLLLVPGKFYGDEVVTKLQDKGLSGDYAAFTFDPNSLESPNKVFAAVKRAAEINGQGTQEWFYGFVQNEEFKDEDDLHLALNKMATLMDMGVGKTVLSKEENFALGKFLMEDEDLKDNYVMQAAVISPFRPLRINKVYQDMMNAGIMSDDFFSSKPFEAQFKTLYGYSLTDFRERYKAFEDANRKLAEYRRIIAGKDTVSGGLVEWIKRQVGATFAAGGTVDQLFAAMGLDPIDNRLDTSGFIRKFGDDMSKIAQADVLRFIIAADLARAEDSAGRLSDGDIMRNLQKLQGFGRATIDSELDQVDKVISTLNDQFGNLRMLNAIAGKADKMTRRDRELLSADKVAGMARNEYLISVGKRRDNTEDDTSVIPTLEEFNGYTPLFDSEKIVDIGGTSRTFTQIRNGGTAAQPKYFGIQQDGTIVFIDNETIGKIVNSSSAPSSSASVTAQPSSEAAVVAQPGGPPGGTASGTRGSTLTPGVSPAAKTEASGATVTAQSSNETTFEASSEQGTTMTFDEVVTKTGDANPPSRVTIDGIVYTQGDDGNYKAAM